MKENPVVVGLDIGTTKVCAVVSTKNEFNKTQIIGFGSAEMDEGVARASIININKTSMAIKKATLEAEQTSSYKITAVNVGISGEFVQCSNISADLTVNPEYVVNHGDVIRLLKKAKRTAQEMMTIEKEIIHLIPQEFTIDDQRGIVDPVGMAGQYMKGQVYVISGIKNKLRNIRMCIERSNLKAKTFTFEPISSGIAVMKEDEKKSGVAVVDIGGGTTDVSIYKNGIISHSDVIKVAAKDVTRDLMYGLKILERTAENLKIHHGYARVSDIVNDEEVPLPGLEGQPVRRVLKKTATSIIEARMIEIFELVRDTIRVSGSHNYLNAGVILTGGGSLIPGSVELAKSILDINVRIGYPEASCRGEIGVELNNPRYSTVVGLAVTSLNELEYQEEKKKEEASFHSDSINEASSKDQEKNEKQDNISQEESNKNDNKTTLWKQFKNWFEQI